MINNITAKTLKVVSVIILLMGIAFGIKVGDENIIRSLLCILVSLSLCVFLWAQAVILELMDSNRMHLRFLESNYELVVDQIDKLKNRVSTEK